MKVAIGMQTSLSLLLAIGLTPVAAFAAEPDGRELYEANCAKCHGPDGKATTPVSKAMKAPSLVDSPIAKGDTHSLKEKIGAIDKHKPITSKLTPEEFDAIAGAVHAMANPKKH